MQISMLQVLTCSPGIGGRRGLRPLFWGGPGIGKSALIETLSSSMNALCLPIIASIREPSDFLGLPMPTGEGADLGVRYAAPDWALRANAAAAKGKLVIVFFDELTTCPPSVQNAMLRVVNEGWVGDVKLHANVVFVAAANPPEMAASGYDLAAPMANRWIHLKWNEPTAAEWSEGILSDWANVDTATNAADVIKKIDNGYDVHHAKAKGLITGFLRSQSLLYKLPDGSSPEASRAWPSPRSWDVCIRAIAGAKSYGLKQTLIDDLVRGAVGKGAAANLLTYEKKANLPDPAKLLDAKDPRKVWKVDPKRPDITAAVFNSCAALVTPRNAKHRDKRAAAMWTLIGGSVKVAGDVAVMAGRSVARAGLTDSPEARITMEAMGHVMKAMGAI